MYAPPNLTKSVFETTGFKMKGTKMSRRVKNKLTDMMSETIEDNKLDFSNLSLQSPR